MFSSNVTQCSNVLKANTASNNGFVSCFNQSFSLFHNILCSSQLDYHRNSPHEGWTTWRGREIAPEVLVSQTSFCWWLARVNVGCLMIFAILIPLLSVPDFSILKVYGLWFLRINRRHTNHTSVIYYACGVCVCVGGCSLVFVMFHEPSSILLVYLSFLLRLCDFCTRTRCKESGTVWRIQVFWLLL